MKTIFAALASVLLIATTQAATIVKATIAVDGKQVILTVNTGGDGLEEGKYWKLLATEPGRAYDVLVKPDKPDGLEANLKGKIKLLLKIRNRIEIGTATTDRLKLIRKDKGSDRWFLPKAEMERFAKLAGVKL